jgi:hypothetical protein
MSEEEEESPVDVEEEEEPPPTSPPGRLSQRREEERCDDGWSFPPRGTREEEWCGSRERQISCSGLGLASS